MSDCRWKEVPHERLFEYFTILSYTEKKQTETWLALLGGTLQELGNTRFRMRVGNVVCPVCQQWVQYTVDFLPNSTVPVCQACRYSHFRADLQKRLKRL